MAPNLPGGPPLTAGVFGGIWLKPIRVPANADANANANAHAHAHAHARAGAELSAPRPKRLAG